MPRRSLRPSMSAAWRATGSGTPKCMNTWAENYVICSEGKIGEGLSFSMAVWMKTPNKLFGKAVPSASNSSLRDLHAALHRFAPAERVEPALDVGILFQTHAVHLVARDPRIGRDVRDRVFAREIRRLAEALFHDAVKPHNLGHEAVAPERLVLGAMAQKIMRLADHRPGALFSAP